jgi:acetylornithine/succinyldiaminopimelate/putrescine aminotransferase
MKEIVPTPPAIVHNEQQAVLGLFQKYVVPSYGRFELVLARGQGSQLWDVNGKRYLDLGGGIAVCSLGHANPEITEALVEQSRRMMHISNLYYHEPSARRRTKDSTNSRASSATTRGASRSSPRSTLSTDARSRASRPRGRRR